MRLQLCPSAIQVIFSILGLSAKIKLITDDLMIPSTDKYFCNF